MTVVRALAAAALLAAGCADEIGPRPQPRGSGSGAAGPGWSLEAVESSLRQQGLEPVRADSVQQPFLTVTGTTLVMGESELQIYLYSDSTAREAEARALDPERVAPPQMMISWRMPATLIVSENLLAILLSQDEALRDEARRALARPPEQPTTR